MFFVAKVAGVECKCLLDTGSNISIIHQSVLDMLPHSPRLRKTPVRARTAARGNLPLLGRVVLCFHIGGMPVNLNVFVSDQIDVPCLLGLDFLQACPCVIDLSECRLVLAPSASVRSVSAEAVSVGRLVASASVSIPPGRESVLRARVPNCDYVGPAIVEPSLEITGLEFVPALVHVEGDLVPFVVRNVTAEYISIPKRAEIGQLEVGFAEQREPDYVGPDGPQITGQRFALADSSLTDEQRARAQAVLDKYASMFDGHLGHTNVLSHTIDTGNHSPVSQPARRVPPHLRNELRAQIDELVRQGVLEETDGGGWASPICLVRKKSGKYRMCADLRRLNAVTRPSSYPVPRIDDTLDVLSGSKMWCVLDLNSAYFQISIDERDRDKTTIVTPFGSHRFVRMPFGCRSAPSTCARLLDVVLSDLRPAACVNYFDDVIVHGSDFDDVLDKLDAVLDRLHRAGLTLNPEKCALFRTEVAFLGHVLSPDGLAADPEKVRQVAQWPVPRTAKELSSFLGLASFFRKYVRSFAEIAAPLFTLTSKEVEFRWSEEAQESFDRLKGALIAAPVVALPRFGPEAGPFTLDCDCSDHGAGAVLFQEQEGEQRVIAFASRKLSKSQRNYSTTRKELLACVLFVQYFRHYLLGRKFCLRTDHASLQWLMNFKQPSGMIARWLEILAEFDFDIVYRPGVQNAVADSLSRRPSDRADAVIQVPECDRVVADVGPPHCADVMTQTEDWAGSAVGTGQLDGADTAAQAPSGVSAPRPPDLTEVDPDGDAAIRRVAAGCWSLDYLRQEQDKDAGIREIARHLSTGTKPRWAVVPESARDLYRQWGRLQLIDGVLYRVYKQRAGEREKLQLVVPRQLVPGVLMSLHSGPSGGHFGSDKLLEQTKVRFWWPKMTAEVEAFCRKCERCCSHSGPSPKPRAAMGELFSDEPFDTISIDFLTGLPTSERGNKHLLVVCDHFTRWCEVYPLPDMKASTVASTLVSEFIARFGVPRRLHSDCAANFVGAVLTETCRILGIERSKISPYHPEGNAKVERMMRTIISMLARYLNDNHSEWDIHLPLLMLGYRSQIHTSLGYSPYFLMFAREPRLPAEASVEMPATSKPKSVNDYIDSLCTSLRVARKFGITASNRRHERNKRAFEKKMNEFNFQPGDGVFVYKNVVPRGQYYKFVRPWKPATVLRKIGDVNYRVKLRDTGKSILVHHNRLKPDDLSSLGDSRGSRGVSPAGELERPGRSDVPASATRPSNSSCVPASGHRDAPTFGGISPAADASSVSAFSPVEAGGDPAGELVCSDNSAASEGDPRLSGGSCAVTGAPQLTGDGLPSDDVTSSPEAGDASAHSKPTQDRSEPSELSELESGGDPLQSPETRIPSADQAQFTDPCHAEMSARPVDDGWQSDAGPRAADGTSEEGVQLGVAVMPTALRRSNRKRVPPDRFVPG